MKTEAAFRKPSPLRKRHQENIQLLYPGQSTSTKTLQNQESTCQDAQESAIPSPSSDYFRNIPPALSMGLSWNQEPQYREGWFDFFFFLSSSCHFEVIYKRASQRPAEEKNFRHNTSISMENMSGRKTCLSNHSRPDLVLQHSLRTDRLPYQASSFSWLMPLEKQPRSNSPPFFPTPKN